MNCVAEVVCVLLIVIKKIKEDVALNETIRSDCIIAKRNDKIIYRDGDATVKLFDANYSKSNVLNEAINQSRVEETGLNIPKIREVTLINGKWAIVMDYIEGTTLEVLMKKHPENYSYYLDLFINIQHDIHSRKHHLLTKFIDKVTYKIMNSQLDASTRYDYAVRLADMPRHASVCHGDFNPSNVIVDKNGMPFILDWSHASQGSASADAAKTYLSFILSGENDRANNYLKRYCELTKTNVSEINNWLPLVAAAQLIKAPNNNSKQKLLALINLFEEQRL